MYKRLVIATAAMALLATSAFAQGLTRYQIRVLNDTSSPIVGIYARNLSTDQLYGNLLRSRVPVNGTTTVTLEDGTRSCFWRIQADLADGREARHNLNVCNSTSWTVTD